MRNGDVLRAVSYPRYTRMTMEGLRIARERGATTIAITDHAVAPAAQIAEITLLAGSGPVILGNSYAATMVLIDALIGSVLKLVRDSSLTGLEELEKILERYDVMYAGKTAQHKMPPSSAASDATPLESRLSTGEVARW
jgi:DNA-binding MurR/RpiR family transcriptional regulator